MAKQSIAAVCFLRSLFICILGDKWLSGKIYTNRDEARSEVRWIMTEGNRFEIGQRARISTARVVAH